MRDVEWDECDRHSRMEDNMRGMRIYTNIELCLRRDIAMLEDRAAHDDKFLHSFGELRLFADCYRKICERSNRKDADLIGFGKDALDQIIYCMLGDRFCFWFWQL